MTEMHTLQTQVPGRSKFERTETELHNIQKLKDGIYEEQKIIPSMIRGPVGTSATAASRPNGAWRPLHHARVRQSDTT